MKYYDVTCPACGHKNLHLYLDETGGWMECERCETLSQNPAFIKIRKAPAFPRESSGPGMAITAAAS